MTRTFDPTGTQHGDLPAASTPPGMGIEYHDPLLSPHHEGMAMPPPPSSATMLSTPQQAASTSRVGLCPPPSCSTMELHRSLSAARTSSHSSLFCRTFKPVLLPAAPAGRLLNKRMSMRKVQSNNSLDREGEKAEGMPEESAEHGIVSPLPMTFTPLPGRIPCLGRWLPAPDSNPPQPEDPYDVGQQRLILIANRLPVTAEKEPNGTWKLEVRLPRRCDHGPAQPLRHWKAVGVALQITLPCPPP